MRAIIQIIKWLPFLCAFAIVAVANWVVTFIKKFVPESVGKKIDKVVGWMLAIPIDYVARILSDIDG